MIKIDNATFYRQYPTEGQPSHENSPRFSNLSFSLPANTTRPHQYWSVISSSAISRTTFLRILSGQYICIPPVARTYPDLGADPSSAIRYVGFDAERQGGAQAGPDIQGSHLSARYESHREPTDFTLWQYLMGQTELNALEDPDASGNTALLDQVSEQLNLNALLSSPVSNLSNGQTRRAKIAKALMLKPALLLLDGPFMGLDPHSTRSISTLLQSLAQKNAPSLFLSLRPEENIPEWITHLVSVNSKLELDHVGPRSEHTNFYSSRPYLPQKEMATISRNTPISRDGIAINAFNNPDRKYREPIVEMQGVQVRYGQKPILGYWASAPSSTNPPGLHWTISRGERWSIFGPNGSGKTTLLSLMTSDHPQTYSLPIKLFGRSRLSSAASEPAISVFELQRRIGHSSPEVHAFFPKKLSLRRVLESAFADAPLAKPVLTPASAARIDLCLQWFAPELNPNHHHDRPGTPARHGIPPHSDPDVKWANNITFFELPFSNQRLALFLRAIVSSPDLVILDEAFGGMDASVRDKALLFLSWGETKVHDSDGHVLRSGIPDDQVLMSGLSDQQALVTISHSADDVPGCVDRWICLPDPEVGGPPPRWGQFPGPLELHADCWKDIWGL